MAPNARSAKRARVQDGDSSSELEHATLKHDDEFWFDDGNLILVARGTGFKIYRGLLTAQSSVFADMFATSSVEDTEKHADCPVVHLTESSDDLRDLLRVLLPKSRRV